MLTVLVYRGYGPTFYTTCDIMYAECTTGEHFWVWRPKIDLTSTPFFTLSHLYGTPMCANLYYTWLHNHITVIIFVLHHRNINCFVGSECRLHWSSWRRPVPWQTCRVCFSVVAWDHAHRMGKAAGFHLPTVVMVCNRLGGWLELSVPLCGQPNEQWEGKVSHLVFGGFPPSNGIPQHHETGTDLQQFCTPCTF